MKLRIAGYMLLVIGFVWAMFIIWPSLYGKYPFMSPEIYWEPQDTGEMVSKKSLIMHGQEVLMISLDKQARVIHPILMMLCGAIVLDIAGRRQRKAAEQ